MKARDLLGHKIAVKNLQSAPDFRPLKRGKLPKPFDTAGGPRMSATPLIDVSPEHCILLMYRDGPILTDTAFYAHFMVTTQRGLYPLLHFHWHPSHKGFHCKVPCDAQIDYTNRMLPGASELGLKTRAQLDPRDADDRLQLIHTFCKICGINLGGDHVGGQAQLWETL